jgi:chemotaxis regulatin CheY-phosphate phosphatase CheZ
LLPHPRRARMHKEIATLANRLFNLLNELEQHVPPADLTGKRLIYEAHQRLKEIADRAEQTAQRTQ